MAEIIGASVTTGAVSKAAFDLCAMPDTQTKTMQSESNATTADLTINIHFSLITI
jgi:hypothetical protein